MKDSKWKRQLIIIEKASDNQRGIQNPVKHLRWSFLTIFVKHFILDVSQGYGYLSGKAKENLGALSLIPQKIRTAISANFFHF